MRATVLVGRNGAGKSTTLRTIMGLNPATSGTIEMEGQAIQKRKPYEIAHLGIGYVPEDNAVVYSLTVEENLRLAMFQESEAGWRRLETIFQLFPDLKTFLAVQGRDPVRGTETNARHCPGPGPGSPPGPDR